MGFFKKLFEALESGSREEIYVPKHREARRTGSVSSKKELYDVELGEGVDVAAVGDLDQDIVGEASYQDNLDQLVGKSRPEGRRVVEPASLLLEDDNPHDDKAVKVEIHGKTVGHLSRAYARKYRKGSYPSECFALIIGGFRIEFGEWANYGVRLDVNLRRKAAK